MQELFALFGGGFGIDEIVDCRVTRMKMGGVVGAAIAGSEPTELRIVLRDGRRLEARSRGPGTEQDAIEAVVRAVNEAKARTTMDAITVGGSSAFGDVQVSADGVTSERRLVMWEQVVSWAVHEGYLHVSVGGGSDLRIWLANVPFGDALAMTFALRVPDKDLRRVVATPEYQAAHAKRSRFTRAVLLAIVLVIGLGVGGVYGGSWLMTRRAYAQRDADHAASLEKALAALAAPPSVPPCTTKAEPSALLVSADKATVLSFRSGTYPPWQEADLKYGLTYGVFWVWSSTNGETRVIAWDPRTDSAICSSVGRTSAAAPKPLDVAERIAEGNASMLAPTASSAPPVASASVASSAASAPPKKKKKR